MNEPPSREAVLFGEALALPAAQRAHYLDEACGTNAELRRAVQVLLDAHDEAGAFLQTATTGGRLVAAAANPILAAAENSVPVQKPGDRIGRYKLLEQIGEGGCGVVYMAEQEEPVRRRVALKIIKLGMDTKEVIVRFEAERQALAMMDHPNIAKVLDAGATETGRPYFVMELVRGTKITDYCDQNNLTTKERLDLFSQVCRAIQHAHQKGIIHRDVKPSNILVTLHDGVPVPKVIDFGIAKATQGRLTDQTFFTAFQQFIGTPAYMSPEQAEMSGLDIDTRSDIYSLGVLLYELLTGKTPFDGKELLAAGVDAMRRTIREKEPQPPSTRLSTMLAGELTATAKHRQIEAAKLPGLVRGDLDWIVMKCLEKDRTRRYETANGLASDIQRYLGNDAVIACPPSAVYRFRKLVRRNRVAVTVAGIVAATLLFGFGVSLFMFTRERDARERAVAAEQQQARLRTKAEINEQKARIESIRSEQTVQLLKSMLASVAPSAAQGRNTEMMREVLDKTLERAKNDGTIQMEVRADLLNTVGRTYWEIGESANAEKTLRLAVTLATNAHSGDHATAAEAMASLGSFLRYSDRPAEAQQWERLALDMYVRLYGNEHPKVVETLTCHALTLSNLGKHADAEEMLLHTLRICNTTQAEPVRVALALRFLGEVLYEQKKFADAEAKLLQARAIWVEKSALEPSLPWNQIWLAKALMAQGKTEEAERTSIEAWVIAKRILAPTHPDVHATVRQLASVFSAQGKVHAEENLYREWIQLHEQAGAIASPTMRAALALMDGLLHRENKLNEPGVSSGSESPRHSAKSPNNAD